MLLNTLLSHFRYKKNQTLPVTFDSRRCIARQIDLNFTHVNIMDAIS
jgi:hypothetical protein